MALLVSRSQYEARVGKTFTGTKAAQVEAFLEDASEIVKYHADGELDDATLLTLPKAIVPVIVAMVSRGLHNPRGHESEKIGDYSYSGGGSLFATEEEIAVIQRSAGVSAIGSVEMTAPMPLHLAYDIWNNPTYP